MGARSGEGWLDRTRPLPALVHKIAKDPKDDEAALVRMRKHIALLADAWGRYETRATEVAGGIAKAKELAAAKDLTGAKQTLRELITAAPSVDRVRVPVRSPIRSPKTNSQNV